MDDRQLRTLRSFRMVVAQLQQYPLVPEPPLMTAKLKSLRATIKRIETLQQQQQQAAHAMSGGVEAKKRLLRRQVMLPLSHFARPHLDFAPGVERALTVPHASASALRVAKAGIALADALAPHTRHLVSAGADREMLKRLRTDARALALVARRTDAARQRRSALTRDIAAALEKGKNTVDTIEGMVELRYAGQSGKLDVWRKARRVSKRIGRPRKRRRPAPPEGGPELTA